MHFTFITPTYNRPRQLERCLQSMLALDYPDWHAIIVNDGSSADYSSVAQLHSDSRFEYISLPANQGVNFARNRALDALEAHQTDYVCFIDDDEYFTPTALSIAAMILKDTQHPWLVLKCFLNDGQTTVMTRTGEMDYIDDYLYGKSLQKDATHFIQSKLAKSAHFSGFARNGDEWVYFAGLAKKNKIWAEPVAVKHNYHQPDGLFKSPVYGKKLLVAYVMKLYRPWVALTLRPTNKNIMKAFLLQLLKLPLRLPEVLLRQIGRAWVEKKS